MEEDVSHHENHHHELLMGLKSTVEGLLATPTSNVWSTYGGLDRVSHRVEKILIYRLLNKLESDDYWPFVKQVKWLDPVLDPFIDGINRLSPNPDGFSKGYIWLRQSLHQHTTSSQLKTLVDSTESLLQHYHEDAFLCNQKYVQALLICLYAIEHNKVTLLADINPTLLTLKTKYTGPKPESCPVPIGPAPSASMYVGVDGPKHENTPPYVSPKRARALSGISHEQAIPIPSSEEIKDSAKDAMRSVLDRSGTVSPNASPPRSFSFYDSINSDPLLNFEFTGAPGENNPQASHLTNCDIRVKENQGPDSKDFLDGKGGHLTSKQSMLPVDRTKSLFKSVSLDERSCDRDGPSVEPSVSVAETSRQASNCNSIGSKSEISAAPNTAQTRTPDTIPPHVHTSSISNVKTEPNKSTQSKLPTHKRCRSDVPFVRDTQTLPAKMNNFTNKSNNFLTNNNKPSQKTGPHLSSRHMMCCTDGNPTRPAPGQSLMSFLTSQDFNTCANLERENAHFSISEILISAIEQMKWKHVISPQHSSDVEDGDSDEEIQTLKQRIRIRRHERMKEKARRLPAFSDGRTDNSSESSDGIDDQEIELSFSDKAETCALLKSSGLSLSMASLYSDADLFQRPPEKSSFSSTMESCNSSQVSAESVAISLLKKFSEKQHPKASDLQWMVSEKDAPQALLPLPNSYPISPDDEYADLRNRTRLRGNLEWAPPRFQIIFSIHPTSKRSVTIPKQNYRCAGCGARVEPAYMKRFRYCEYLGKYFCQCCHSNATAYIPGRILQKWDFSKYYVSKYSVDLLTKISNEPFFNIEDINSALYRRVKALENIKQYRLQLVHLATLMKICRYASVTIYPLIEKLPGHIVREIHTYSIADLILVKNGELLPILKNIVTTAISHVKECQHCPCFGFICELCNNEHDIIFPFQLSKAINCPDCKACYHQSCFVPNKCPKCARIAIRRKIQQQRSADLEEDNG